MSNQPPPNPEPGKNLPPDRWGHLTFYERRYLQDAIKAYDAIVDRVDDIGQIANRYQLDIEDVRRAKDYAFVGYLAMSLPQTLRWQKPGLEWHQEQKPLSMKFY